MKTGPWIVSMQRPAPGGKVRSAQADTETISGTSILMVLLSGLKSSDMPDRLRETCFCSILLTCTRAEINFRKKYKFRKRKEIDLFIELSSKSTLIVSMTNEQGQIVFTWTTVLIGTNGWTNQDLPVEALPDSKQTAIFSNHYEVPLHYPQVVPSNIQFSGKVKAAVDNRRLSDLLNWTTHLPFINALLNPT